MDNLKITHDGTDWIVIPIDITHLFLTTDPDRKGVALHVAQITDDDLRDTVRAFLRKTFCT